VHARDFREGKKKLWCTQCTLCTAKTRGIGYTL
jgi:hypothetical protein